MCVWSTPVISPGHPHLHVYIFHVRKKKWGEHFIISEEGKMLEVVREIEWYNLQWLILSTNLLEPINCTVATWAQFLNLLHWRWTVPETALNWMQWQIPVKWCRSNGLRWWKKEIYLLQYGTNPTFNHFLGRLFMMNARKLTIPLNS